MQYYLYVDIDKHSMDLCFQLDTACFTIITVISISYPICPVDNIEDDEQKWKHKPEES